jgi:hypothetical protein
MPTSLFTISLPDNIVPIAEVLAKQKILSRTCANALEKFAEKHPEMFK